MTPATLIDTALVDTFGRTHNNLRISVTDRCNIRCFYCMPETDVHFYDRREILSFEEIERFARVAAGLGVDKLRITGGEPLVRKNLPLLIAKLAAIPGIRDIAMTTNGVLLAAQARSLYDAGLRRLNVHLDTLDRARFLEITRRDDLDKVLEGIEVCQEMGFGPIKINAVAVKGLTETDVVPLARYGRERGIEVPVTSNSCRSMLRRYGTAAVCCWRTTWLRCCRAKSARWRTSPTPIRGLLPPNTALPTASAGWDSSRQ